MLIDFVLPSWALFAWNILNFVILFVIVYFFYRYFKRKNAALKKKHNP